MCSFLYYYFCCSFVLMEHGCNDLCLYGKNGSRHIICCFEKKYEKVFISLTAFKC